MKQEKRSCRHGELTNRVETRSDTLPITAWHVERIRIPYILRLKLVFDLCESQIRLGLEH